MGRLVFLSFAHNGAILRKNTERLDLKGEKIKALSYSPKGFTIFSETNELMVVARERFELSSSGPKPDMLDHYTNGLHGFN